MPRYYLHLRDGLDEVIDPEGIDLPDVEAVRTAAIEAARDVMSHSVREGHLDLAAWIDVEDEDGEVILTQPFIDAAQVILP